MISCPHLEKIMIIKLKNLLCNKNINFSYRVLERLIYAKNYGFNKIFTHHLLRTPILNNLVKKFTIFFQHYDKHHLNKNISLLILALNNWLIKIYSHGLNSLKNKFKFFIT